MSTMSPDLQGRPSYEDDPTMDGMINYRKRRRKVLSCFTCRRRKLRCDREYPSCARCRRAGCADSCTYDVTTDSDPMMDGRPTPIGGLDGDSARMATTNTSHGAGSLQSPVSTGPAKNKTRLAERKANMLGGRAARLENAAGLLPDDPELLEANRPDWDEAVLFKGKGFKTQFYGATSPLSVFVNVSRTPNQAYPSD